MCRPAETDFRPKPLRVLVVEDEPDTATSLFELIEIWGYECAIARDGAEALDAAREHLPDVVLLDLGLPVVDGWEVARKLTAVGLPKLPFVVALSGYQKRLHETGVNLHLVKPVDPEAIRRILERFERVLSCEPPEIAVA
jgi:CheY-like chemotaxis protein